MVGQNYFSWSFIWLFCQCIKNVASNNKHLASKAEEIFCNTQVTVSTQGRLYLGAPLGFNEYIEKLSSKESQMGKGTVLITIA